MLIRKRIHMLMSAAADRSILISKTKIVKFEVFEAILELSIDLDSVRRILTLNDSTWAVRSALLNYVQSPY